MLHHNTLTPIAKETNEKRRQQLKNYTADELDALARQGRTVLGTYYFTMDMNDTLELAGGWNCRYVGNKEIGAKGQIILFPNSNLQWNRDIWSEGQIALAVSKGLTEQQAARWFQSRISSKHAVLEILGRLISRNKPDEIRTCMEYSSDLSGDALNKWRARSGIIEDLHPARIQSLIELLREVHTEDNANDSPILGYSDILTAAEIDVDAEDKRPWE